MAPRTPSGRLRLVKVLQIAASLFLFTGAALLVEALPAAAAGVVGTMTLSPTTGVADGTVLTVTGSGFTHSSIGNILECNSDPNQPTVALPAPISTSVSVSCSPPSFSKLVSTSATGTISASWTVLGPTVGPPCGNPPDIAKCPATDSSGGNPATDAANYPCPPTAAQQAAGDVCQLNYGDSAGDSATANIGFPTSTTTTTAAGTTTTTGATTTTTGATTTTTSATTTTTSPSGPQTSAPYEIYCPGTPVGTIALNDVTSQGSISPASPSSGQQFNLTSYQVTVTIPQTLASAAAGISPTLSGTATGTIDATGATPATLPTGTLNFNVTIPNPVPANGVQLIVPATPVTLGPFTASSSSISIAQDSSISLSLVVAGAPLNLTCTAYPNDMINPGGITSATPTASPITPVIATAGGSTTTTTTTTPSSTTTTSTPSSTTTTATPASTTTTPATGSTTTTPTGSTTTTGGSTTTTAASHATTTTAPPSSGSGGSGGNTAQPVTASSSGLAFTGPGPGVAWLVLIGAGLVILGFALFLLVDAPRRALAFVTTLGTNRLRGVRLPRLAVPSLRGRMRLPRVRTSTPSAGAAIGAARSGSRLSTWVPHAGGRMGASVSRLATRSATLTAQAARVTVQAAMWLLGR
ncbi:MAG TPA: hypothetical protein VKU86_01520 [Acidimicrobiales bacterium]|nr:hypothetical protein [Acidimicrobiales bacterium]